jgi:magnesium transporter
VPGPALRSIDPGLPRARLYDADGRDRDVVLTPGLADKLKSRQLLWIDVDSRDPGRFEAVIGALDVPERVAARILEDLSRAAVIRFKDGIHLTVEAIEADGDEDDRYRARELDILAKRNIVVTVHEGPIAALDRFQDQLHGDTLMGQLDSGSFLEAIVDTVLTTYFSHVEDIERDIDKLDELAMRVPDSGVFLVEMRRLRQRVARLRRTIAPHREAFAVLARPDVALDDVLGHSLPTLAVRLERVIDAVENARELLVGSFDIYLGGAAHRSNEVMKALTIVSSVLLPAVVIATVMGMNFHLAFFDEPSNFWLVVAAMVVFALVILAVARLRRWI